MDKIRTAAPPCNYYSMTQLRIDGEPPSSLLLFTSNLIFIPTIIAGLLGRWGDVYIITTQAV